MNGSNHPGGNPPGTADERLWRRLGRLAYGGDYNAEQWDERTWALDIELMNTARVNLVTVGVFAWAELEPEPGRFEFGWLDRVMDMLSQGGISVCLATATASPPPWMSEHHPETLPVDLDGRRLWHGSRQHFCPSSPSFRARAAALVENLAERYREHPALAAWHVGNEYGCELERCYCDVSAEDFRHWLQRRHGDLDALNRAWSTTFWSQKYSSWAQVLPPRATPASANPAQQLDFLRFSSDALLACFENEASILRRMTPEVPLTTNFLGMFKPVDGFAWATREDFVSVDSYPDPADPDAALGAAMTFDLMRGASGGRRWLVMEQAPDAVNWRAVNQPKPRGVYRLWSWQAIAHGAAGALSFQWRASRGGAEKFHSAFVPHGGPDSDDFRQVAELGREFEELPELVNTVPERAEVAIVLDWSSWWALELPSHPSDRLRLVDLVRAWYAPLWRAAVPVDLVPPSVDLSAYRVVLAPNLYLVDDAWIDSLHAFIHGGGHLAMGFFSGLVDTNEIIRDGPYPGALRDLLGVEVHRFRPLHEHEHVALSLASGTRGEGSLWSEELSTTDAEVAGMYEGGELRGSAAVTVAPRSQGRAWYLSTLPDPATLAAILTEVTETAGVSGLLARSAVGVEAAVRRGDDERVLFLLNHGSRAASVTVADGWRDWTGSSLPDDQLRVPARDLAMLRRPL